MASTSSTNPSDFDRSTKNAFTRDFAPAVLGYVAVLAVLLLLVDFDSPASWKYLVALAPLVPAIWGVRAIARHVSRVDEMQRSLLLEALAAGFGASMSAAITLGLLGSLTGFDSTRWGAWTIYGVGMATWSIVGIRAERR